MSTRRDQALVERLVALLHAAAACTPMLVMVDGFASYVEACRKALRFTLPMGTGGRPHTYAWPDFVLGQVIKQRVGKRLVGITLRVAQGSGIERRYRLWQTPGCVVPNTADMERLNGTFRTRLAILGRRTQHLAHRKEMLHARMYVLGAVYNFCSFPSSLTRKEGAQQTPAMAAGSTTTCWTVADLRHYTGAPPRWTPPKQRGRRSKQMQACIERWAT